MKTDPLGDERLWERLRYRKVPIKKHVLGSLPESAGSMVADRLWQSFKQRCAAEGNLVPLLISQLEPQECDPGMFRRRGPRKPKGSDPFGDLPLIQRLQAEEKFRQLCEKWARESAALATRYLGGSCPPIDAPPRPALPGVSGCGE